MSRPSPAMAPALAPAPERSPALDRDTNNPV